MNPYDREHPRNVNPARVDRGVTALLAEFPGDSWTRASLREIVGVLLASQVAPPCDHTTHLRQMAMRFGRGPIDVGKIAWCDAHNGAPELTLKHLGGGATAWIPIDEWTGEPL